VLGFNSTDKAMSCEVILIKLNYKLVRIMRLRKKRRYYKDSDKPVMLVA
jgi:hypothetical protein